MIDMDKKEQIPHFLRIDGLSLRENSRRVGVNRKTATRYIREYEGQVHISEEGKTLKTIEHIFVDNLISILDSEIEKCENYEERISQEYGIITETEE